MQSFKEFFKKNYHWIVLGVFTVLMLITHQFVLIYGNDYYHASAVAGTVQDFVNFHVKHYMEGNGRALIHVVLTLFFIGKGVLIWRILNPIVFALVIILCAKAFIYDPKDRPAVIVILSVLYLCLGGRFTSYSTYSLTPVFNYIYPFLLTLPLICCINRIYADGKKYPALPVLGFFAGATMEQTGMMTIGYIVLIVFFHWILNKKKPAAVIIVTFVTTLIGFATVMLAPGNTVRMEGATRPFTENFVAATTMLVNNKPFVLLNLFLISALSYWLLTLRPKLKLLRICNILLVIALGAGYLVNLFLMYNPFGITFSHPILKLVWVAYDLAYVFAMVYVPVLIAFCKKNYEYLSHAVIALGSIFMLFFASISVWRPLTPAIVIFFVFIAQTCLDLRREHPKALRPIAAAAVVLSLWMFCFSLRGYYRNYQVDRINDERIAAYLENGETGKPLYLLQYADEETSGYGINVPGADYDPKNEKDEVLYLFAAGYRKTHGLPPDVEMIFSEK